ncbi:MAG: 2-phospho-L-lactate transferase [Chloroflexi bacterium]|nr:2-phospho-L-lactate transferase [Chloroflexota bacterium]
MTRVAVLAGGVGAARFLDGLVRIVPPSDVTAIVNVGDDMEWAGLHISPDLDTVTYTLADLVNPDTGWGLRGESRRTLDRLSELGGPDWFMIGDLDLATHLYRTDRLSAGDPLSEITRDLAVRLGLECVITPVTDDRLRTVVGTDQGELAFQDYFVRRRASDPVHALRFDGEEAAKPAPIVEHALSAADVIVIAPSNPFLSIDPLLSVSGVREQVTSNRAKVVAVSPIVGGQAVKGPAADILQSLGHDVSALGVARLYEDLAKVFVLDETDAALADVIAAETGMRVVVMPTLMTDVEAKMALARGTLEAALDVA